MGDGWDLTNIDQFRDMINAVTPMIFQAGWHSTHANDFKVWRVDVDGTFGAHQYGSMWFTNMADLRTIAGSVPIPGESLG